MEKFVIAVKKDTETLNFEVLDFAHDDSHRCKFDILLNNRVVASFEPDNYGYLHICKNPGNIDQTTLHYIAEKIEAHNF